MTAPAGPAPEQRELDLFDYQHIRNVVGFVLRGVRRHRLLSVATFLFIAGAGIGITMLLPRTWHTEARLLANQNQLIRALGNPRSSLPSEDPTRAAREIVFAHNNLVSLIKQTNLMKQWEQSRPAIVKLRDQAVQLVSGPLSEEDQIDAMVGTLEKRLKVETDAQTVSISIDWPDAQMAYLLVETAQQNFLETRHVTEMTAISEALSILDVHAANVQKTVDDALHELERVREQRRKGGGIAQPAPLSETGNTAAPLQAAAGAPGKALGSGATEQELNQVKFLLNSKRRALADLEEFRARRVAELNAQLAEQKAQYADQHPVVLDLTQRIQTLQRDSSQMVAVKEDIQSLIQEYKRKGGKDPDALVEPTARPVRAAQPRLLPQAEVALSNADLADDPLVEFARNNLRVAAAKYEELMMRIDGARIEQDTARAAFKYRYSVVRPASVPRKPVKPDALLLGIVSLLLALSGAMLVGAARDWSRGRIVEPWQVERALGLRVLGRVKAP